MKKGQQAVRACKRHSQRERQSSCGKENTPSGKGNLEKLEIDLLHVGILPLYFHNVGRPAPNLLGSTSICQSASATPYKFAGRCCQVCEASLHASTGLAHHVMVLPDEDSFMSERALGIGGTTYRLACVHGPEM